MTVLWDVDTQVDFMLPDGKLYVPGAEQTIPAMQRLVDGGARGRDRARRLRRRPRAHRRGDLGRSRLPHDLSAALPARHARRRKIPETEQEDPVPLTLELPPWPERYLEGREFLLLKKNFDVFTNPNTERLLDALDPDEIVVFGVATDVCDDAAIRGFLARGLQSALRRGRCPRARRGAGGDLHGLLARSAGRIHHAPRRCIAF